MSEQTEFHRKTCVRRNIPGHAHFLTFSCFHRRPFLLRDQCRDWLCNAILKAREDHRIDVWAYVFMPEHVHLVIYPRNDQYSISAILTTIKQSVSKRAILFVRQNAPEFLPHMTDAQPNGRMTLRFWQRGGGYDRNLHGKAEVWEKIRYIHDNPVTRGLVSAAEDWHWSSAADYAGLRKGPLPIDAEFIPR